MPRIAPLMLAAIPLLAGCSLDPDYQRPPLPVAQTWPGDTAEPSPGAEKAPTPDQLGWHDYFTDPRLQHLIEIALRNNRDLRVAILNVETSNAQFRSQRADLFPTIDLTGTGLIESEPNSTTVPISSGSSSSGSGSSGSGTSGSGSTGTGTGSSGGSTGQYQTTGTNGGIYHYYTASVGFENYELDVFGHERSLTRQAFEAYLSTAETRRSTQLTLIGEVAAGYFTLLADDDLLRLTRETLASQTDSYRLTQAMYDHDTATALSLRQAESTVDSARAALAQYTRQRGQDEDALVLLLGEPIPADLPAGRSLDDQGLLAELPAGLPSDLLARRPDIMAAEHTLLAANANIGAARAAFFPSITLTASDGVASNRLSSLFTSGAMTWSFAPQLNLPIFTAGQNQANLEVAKSEKAVDVARYEQTIQTAFREVADALIARGTYRDQLAAEAALVAADAESYRLSQMRFQAGIDNYLTALDSERSLFSAEQTLVSLKESQLANLVTLYKALGGGWNENTVAPQVQAANPPAPDAARAPS